MMEGMEGPVPVGGHWIWRDRHHDTQILFAGRGPDRSDERDAVLQRIAPGAPPVAWAKQIHSARVLPALPGACGEGDALVGEMGLALSVVTADCVPVVLAGPGGLAAVHAGWRGIAARIVAATLDQLDGPLTQWTAWIGPAIGPCCYEVGEDVAEQVAAVSGPEVILPAVHPGQRPHLDVTAAVRRQLEDAGVRDVRVISHCTLCDGERLWSYRRDGKGAGRNLAFIWRG
ncbi:MAG TPA: polyphenol oxidase family protein [Thermoanaerobaculia bacterium]|nr:polyphenol oxidase family protein [Thermoanaerobaculia bacterium]